MSEKRVPQVVVPAATAKYDIPAIYTIIALAFGAFICAVLLVKSSFGIEWSTALVIAGVVGTGTAVSLDDVTWARKLGIE